MLRRIAEHELPPGSAPDVRELLAAQSQGVVSAVEQARAVKEVMTKLQAQLDQQLAGPLGEFLRTQLNSLEGLRALLDRELARVRAAHTVCVYVHPEDLGLLESAAVLEARAELDGVLTLVADAGLSRGGCVVESNVGDVDARLETRVERVRAALLEGIWK